jgi:hypothetical protein
MDKLRANLERTAPENGARSRLTNAWLDVVSTVRNWRPPIKLAATGYGGRRITATHAGR